MLAATVSEPTLPTRLNTLGHLTLLLIAIVGGIVFYYYFEMFERGSEHVYRRNFRTLAQIEAQINNGLERIRVVATNHNFDSDFPLRVAGITYTHALPPVPKPDGAGKREKSLCVPDLPFAESIVQQGMFYRAIPHGDSMRLTLCIWPAEEAPKHPIVQVNNVPLADLVNWRDALEQFHQVLIFDSTRRLVLRSGANDREIAETDLHDLLTNKGTTHETIVEIPDSWNGNEVGTTDHKDTMAPVSTGGTKPDQANDSPPPVLGVSKVQELSIGTQKYLAFIRPIELSVADINRPRSSPTWYVIGLTTESEFNSSRFLLPRWWVALGVLALLMFILGLPYIKLKLLGPHDLIRHTTVTAAVVCLLLVASLATTVLLNWRAHDDAEQNAMQRLPVLAEKLATNIDDEYREATEWLDEIALGKTEKMGKFGLVALFDTDGNMCAVRQVTPITFRHISIRDRQYWNEFAAHQDLLPDRSDRTFAQEVVDTYVDGKREAVIAKRLNAIPNLPESYYQSSITQKTCEQKKTSSAHNFFTLTGIVQYKSLDQAIFPKGFGFIVIDNRTGIVQYHAEEHENLIERLYEETDNNAALKDAINAQDTATFQTRYRGISYLFHTQPLAYPNWTLITYFNREFLDDVNLGLMLSAAVLSCAYVLALIAVVAFCFKFFSNSKINHLWPNPRQAVAYRELLIVLAIVTITECIAVYVLRAEALSAVLIAAPMLAASMSYICLVNRYQPFDTFENYSIAPNESRLQIRVLATLFLVAVALSILAVHLASTSLQEAADSHRNQADAPHQILFLYSAGAAAIGAAALFGVYARLLPADSEERGTFRFFDLHFLWSWRRSALQFATALSATVLLYSFLMSPRSPALLAPSLVIAAILLLTHRLLRRKFIPVDRAANTAGAPKAMQVQRHQMYDLFSASDRRSDRDKPHALHRWCLTLLVAITVLLPTIAFYRDSTSVYILRWLQQDALKFRSRLERVSDRNPVDDPLLVAQTGANVARINATIGANNWLSTTPYRCSEMRAASDDITILSIYSSLAKNFLTLGEEPATPLERTIMLPTLVVSDALSSQIPGLGKENADSRQDGKWNEWWRCDDQPTHVISVQPLLHDDPAKPQWLELSWHFEELAPMDWIELWIGLAIGVVGVVRPMIRLVLRELVQDFDLLAAPELSRVELDLLADDWHGLLVLVSADALGQRECNLLKVEEEIVKELRRSLMPGDKRIERLDIALAPRAETDVAASARCNLHDLPTILVVAEQRWFNLTQQAWTTNIDYGLGESATTEWRTIFKALHKIRLPDDCPNLALHYWQPTRNFTLLTCHSLDAQDTLVDFVRRRHTATDRQWTLYEANRPLPTEQRIWIPHVEALLQQPHQRRRLLEFLEGARRRENPPTIVMTSLVLPHLWITAIDPWTADDAPGASEQVRWLAVLSQVNLRSVSRLDIVRMIGETARARHALPSAAREAEYALWWRYSTLEERMTLGALAHEGLINPYNRTLIRSLLARGLIFHRRTLHFSDRGFHSFVKYHLTAAELHRRADRTLQHSSWGAARGPLFGVVAVLGYAVMVTGGGAAGTVAGLIASASAAVPVLLNLTRLFRRDGSA